MVLETWVTVILENDVVKDNAPASLNLGIVDHLVLVQAEPVQYNVSIPTHLPSELLGGVIV